MPCLPAGRRQVFCLSFLLNYKNFSTSSDTAKPYPEK
jgi:hypothetical protein